MNPFIQLKTIVVVFVLLAWAGFADAQFFPTLKRLPPKKDASALKSTPALAPNSPWQLLTNQPPVLDYTDCGPGNPILLTDGTVMLADNGCQDWWKLTPDEFGSYVNGTWTSWLRCQTATARCITHQLFFPTAGSSSRAANITSPTESFIQSGQIRAPSMTRRPTPGRSWLLPRFLGALGPFLERSAMPKVSFFSTERSCSPT